MIPARARALASPLRLCAVLAMALLAPASGAAEFVYAPSAPNAESAQALDASLLLWIWVLFVSLCVGSFLNVVVHRLPVMMRRQEDDWLLEALAERAADATATGTDPTADSTTACAAPSQRPALRAAAEAVAVAPEAPAPAPYDLARPRSACPNCGHAITAIENVPVLSWLALRGRCRGCRAPISVRYPLVELTTAALTAAVFAVFGFTAAGVYAALLTWALIAATLIDFDHMLLPDAIVLPILWLGLFANLDGTFTSLDASVIGAIAGYGALWTIFWAFKLLTGKEGMGYGDFRLMGAMGAWLGWQALPTIAFFSALSGIVIFVLLMLAGRLDREAPMPFGPFLAIAGWLTLMLSPTGGGIPGL